MAPRSPKSPRPAGPDAPDPADPNVNPDIAWACGPGKPYYFPPGLQDGPDKRLTLLVQVTGISARDFVEGDAFLKKGDPLRQAWEKTSFLTFPALPKPKSADAGSEWLVAFASPQITTLITAAGPERHVASVVLGRPLNDESLPMMAPQAPQEGLAARIATLSKLAAPPRRRPVFMGVIDDGIAIANERFRVVSGGKHRTRVEDWWIMATGSGGNILTKADIDRLFDACTDSNGVLEEDDFYRSSGLIDFRRDGHQAAAWRATHGTHVMDAACGYAPADNRLDRPIACVQLPADVTALVDNGSLHPYFIPAVWFIVFSMLDYALEKRIQPLPVVINFSYGRLDGAHDGSGSVETFIDAMTTDFARLGIRLRFVLPSGNSYLERTHAQITFAADGGTKTFNWHVQPGDLSESFVEIWTPRFTGGQSRLTLTVKDPLGDSYSIVETDTFNLLGTYGWLSHRNDTTRSVFKIYVPPSAALGPVFSLAPSGTYEISLTHSRGLAPNDYIDAWVGRDDTIPGYPQFGRQSYFDDALYDYRDRYSGRAPQVDNDSLIKRQSTINSIATGTTSIVIGGFKRREMDAAFYSAAGAHNPPRQPPPRWPDAMAPSEDSGVLQGRLAAGTHSGARVPVGGTSVAAPQIARWVADELADGRNGDRIAVQDKARSDEVTPQPLDLPPPPFTAKPPDARSGAGRIWSRPLNKVKRYEY
jgi:hypothetical protein